MTRTTNWRLLRTKCHIRQWKRETWRSKRKIIKSDGSLMHVSVLWHSMIRRKIRRLIAIHAIRCVMFLPLKVNDKAIVFAFPSVTFAQQLSHSGIYLIWIFFGCFPSSSIFFAVLNLTLDWKPQSGWRGRNSFAWWHLLGRSAANVETCSLINDSGAKYKVSFH